VVAARLVAASLDGRGWSVLLLPEQLPALLPFDQIPDADGVFDSGAEMFVALMQSEAEDDARPRGPGKAPPPRLLVSRAAPQLVEGLLTALCPALQSGAVRVAALQRKPGVIVKVALEAAAEGASPRRLLLGERTGGELAAALKELLGLNEALHILDVPAGGDETDAEGLKTFIAAALWPGLIAHVRLQADAGGAAYAYAACEEEVAKAVGRGGGNVAVASALSRRLFPHLAPALIVRNEAEAAADGVVLPPRPVFAPPTAGAGWAEAGREPRAPFAAARGGAGRGAGRGRGRGRGRGGDELRPRSVPSRRDDDALLESLLSEAPAAAARAPVYGGSRPGYWGELSRPAGAAVAAAADAEGLFEGLGMGEGTEANEGKEAAAAQRARWAAEFDALAEDGDGGLVEFDDL